MVSRSHREIAITLALLAMANCAGPDAPREPFPSGGVIPTLQNTAHIWAFHGKNSWDEGSRQGAGDDLRSRPVELG